MKLNSIVSGIAVAAMTVAMMGPAPAQEQSYETHLYTAQPRQTPDPNFGLPTFGLPGAELPRKTTAPPADTEATQTAPGTQAPQPDSDFFKSAGHFANDFPDVAGPDVTLPSDRRRASGRISSSTFGSSSLSTDSTSSSTTDDTPLYTTTDGMTTGDIGSSSTTK